MASSAISLSAGKASLVQIPAGMVGYFWPATEPLLQRVYERTGGDTPADYFNRLTGGKCDLWAILDDGELLAAGITSTAGNTLVIEAIGGRDMPRWVGLIDEIGDMARRYGKTEIEIMARPGWQRVLARYGYSPRRIVLGRTL